VAASYRVCRCKSGPLFHILKFGCTTTLNEVPKGLTAEQEEQIEVGGRLTDSLVSFSGGSEGGGEPAWLWL
jgi:hypothetical protein